MKFFGNSRSAHRSQGSIDHSEITSGGVERACERTADFSSDVRHRHPLDLPQSKLQSDVEQIDAAKDTHLELENYYRTLHPVSLDSQGRLLIPSLIRESVATNKVNVIGLASTSNSTPVDGRRTSLCQRLATRSTKWSNAERRLISKHHRKDAVNGQGRPPQIHGSDQNSMSTDGTSIRDPRTGWMFGVFLGFEASWLFGFSQSVRQCRYRPVPDDRHGRQCLGPLRRCTGTSRGIQATRTRSP